jgi:uncharacterized protein
LQKSRRDRRPQWLLATDDRVQLMFTQPIVLGALTGLASSAHCAAMCGPLAASACARRSPVASLARYQLGRMIGYAIAGALAGGVGRVIALSSLAPWLAGGVSVITALALLVLAQRVLRASSNAEVRERAAVIPLARLRDHTRRERRSPFARLSRVVPREPIALGAFTALLPCAALAAALLLAAGTQARISGAALMLGFAATSALGVLGGGIALTRITQLAGRLGPRALAVALTCAALYVGLRPFYGQVYGQAQTEPSHPAAAAPSCH